MIRPDNIARGWIGTPYQHQASVKGAGTDCLGLIRGVWRERYGHEPAAMPAYSMDWGECGADELLWRVAAAHMAEITPAAARPGDVLLFRMRRGAVAKHLGIMAESGSPPRASVIHAYSGHGVVESMLSDPWARRIVAAFSFPDEA